MAGTAPRILVVDDEPSVIQMIRCVLEIRGIEVVGARDGQEALEYLQSSEMPNLVITDLLMPRLNGLDLCRRIRENPDWSKIPLMIITSATNESDLADGFWKSGTPADDFITKPLDPFDVADRAERLMNNSENATGDGQGEEPSDSGI